MRLKSIFLAISLAGAAFTLPAAAQSGFNDFCPSGNVALLRTNQITAGGTMAGFQQAVADHAKWYASHGYTEDVIYAAPVITFDESTGKAALSPNMVMTFHTHAHPVPREKQDADWTAYVGEYRSNSNIVSETAVCLPK